MTGRARFCRLAVLLGALGAAPPALSQWPVSEGFSDAQLEQMAAPIALYPDALLMQVLMAATYPVEVVQANRWLRANPGLTARALDEALRYWDWDPSVKSLCAFPDLLRRMDENLDWTVDLGDAFLGQQAALLDAVQRLRNAAYAAGSLRTFPEQRVIIGDDRIVVIEPAEPEVIYVPVYYPVAVYGPAWRFPRWYYPPLFLPPPPGARPFGFSIRIVVGPALWGRCLWRLGHHEVDIDIVLYTRFNRISTLRPERFDVWKDAKERGPWQHNAEHRRGVRYRDVRIAREFSGVAPPPIVTRDQARGFRTPTPAPRPVPEPPRRPTAGPRPTVEPPRPTTPVTPPTTRPPRPVAEPTRPVTPAPPSPPAPPRGGTRVTVFSGAGQPALDRTASARGSASRSGGAAASRGAPGTPPSRTAPPGRSTETPRPDRGRSR
ncbi:MAG: DUF3300 domain-containing protein [Planctomycetes bacterium]|nr:DUF3300 domain-containing protein [Planctomycetota bacterium]